ncbi:hypothetical protein Tco_1225409 [Tanacetum coccineum]
MTVNEDKIKPFDWSQPNDIHGLDTASSEQLEPYLRFSKQIHFKYYDQGSGSQGERVNAWLHRRKNYKRGVRHADSIIESLPSDAWNTVPASSKRLKDEVYYILRRTQGYVGNTGKNQATGARVVNLVRNAGAKQLRLQATANFEADHVDAYDSDYDDKAIANAIFMANLSPVDSINDDMVEPCYDSDILFEVPHYDNYHDFDMLNSNIQELGYIENIVSNNESYDELTSNINVISYTDYMLTFGNDDDNYVPPPLQKNDMMLSVIEQIKSQVEKCNMVNQESQSVNESLTSELERYKD